jgi:AcrR family transcriptional regulator
MQTAAGPARAGRAPALPAEERRALIVRATRPLLADHGEAVTTPQIAQAAGIAAGTIFRVFADKDDLLRAVVADAIDTGPLELALRAIDLAEPFEARVLAATEVLQRRVLDVWAVLSNVGPRLRQQVARALPDSEALTALFEPDRDRLTIEPRAAGKLLRALTLALTHPVMAPEPMPAAQAVDLFLHGVERPA